MVADPDYDDLDFQGSEINEEVKTNKEAESVEEFEAVEEVEAVEAEDAGYHEFIHGKTSQDEGGAVYSKSQLMRLYNEQHNLELDLDIRKRNAEFGILIKKVVLGFSVLIGVLVSMLVFIEVVGRIMPGSEAPAKEMSIAVPSTVSPVPSVSPAEVFSEPQPIATVPQPVYREPAVNVAPPVTYREPIQVAPAVNVAAPITYREPIQVAPAVNVAAPIAYREPINTAPAQASYTPDPLTAVDTMLVDMLQPVESVTLSQPAPQPPTQAEPQPVFMPMDAGIASSVNVEAFIVPDIPKETLIQAAPPAGATSYQVQWGDSFFQIALDQNIRVDRLAAINGITPPFSLRVGQVLQLNGPAIPSASRATAIAEPVTSKAVQRAETNYRIFATTPSSVWVIDGEANSALEARVGGVLGACGMVVSLGTNFDRIKTTICSDIL